MVPARCRAHLGLWLWVFRWIVGEVFLFLWGSEFSLASQVFRKPNHFLSLPCP